MNNTTYKEILILHFMCIVLDFNKTASNEQKRGLILKPGSSSSSRKKWEARHPLRGLSSWRSSCHRPLLADTVTPLYRLWSCSWFFPPPCFRFVWCLIFTLHIGPFWKGAHGWSRPNPNVCWVFGSVFGCLFLRTEELTWHWTFCLFGCSAFKGLWLPCLPFPSVI